MGSAGPTSAAEGLDETLEDYQKACQLADNHAPSHSSIFACHMAYAPFYCRLLAFVRFDDDGLRPRGR
jgi:hypothetical protein